MVSLKHSCNPRLCGGLRGFSESATEPIIKTEHMQPLLESTESNISGNWGKAKEKWLYTSCWTFRSIFFLKRIHSWITAIYSLKEIWGAKEPPFKWEDSEILDIWCTSSGPQCRMHLGCEIRKILYSLARIQLCASTSTAKANRITSHECGPSPYHGGNPLSPERKSYKASHIQNYKQKRE